MDWPFGGGGGGVKNSGWWYMGWLGVWLVSEKPFVTDRVIE
jgi:hypothetical protein